MQCNTPLYIIPKQVMEKEGKFSFSDSMPEFYTQSLMMNQAIIAELDSPDSPSDGHVAISST